MTKISVVRDILDLPIKYSFVYYKENVCVIHLINLICFVIYITEDPYETYMKYLFYED